MPDGTGTVYLAGGLPQVGNWRPDGLVLAGIGRERSAQVTAAPGTTLEYKFTLGSWDREALNADGTTPPNSRLLLDRDTTVVHDIAQFKLKATDYLADWKNSGVLGRLVIWRDVASKFLGPTRNVEVWLPPGYDDSPTVRYPVLYMHDGQTCSIHGFPLPEWTGVLTRRWCGWCSAALSRRSLSLASGAAQSEARSTRPGMALPTTRGSSSRS